MLPKAFGMRLRYSVDDRSKAYVVCETRARHVFLSLLYELTANKLVDLALLFTENLRHFSEERAVLFRKPRRLSGLLEPRDQPGYLTHQIQHISLVQEGINKMA